MTGMISSPFPPFTGFASRTIEEADSLSIHPRELESLGSGARDKRRREFIMGRSACREALVLTGCTDPAPVLRGKKGEPLWPGGYRGTIAHTSSLAAAAACPLAQCQGLGLDLEDLSEPVESAVFKLVCTDKELLWIHAEPGKSALRFRQIFSAKEAAYKAFFPLVGHYIDFLDAELYWNEKTRVFQGTVLKDLSRTVPRGHAFIAGSILIENLLMSHVFLHA